MKRLFAIILLLSVCSSFGAIKYYDDYPNNANPPTNFIISLQTKDKSAGGIPYNYWTLDQMIDWLASHGVAGQGPKFKNGTLIATNAYITNFYGPFITNFLEYSTNLYVTTNFVDVSYITNLFVNNQFTTNLFTTNFNANFITNITLYSSNIFATNITVDVITNNTFVGGTIITTNIFVDIVTNNSFYTTNITIDVPGGFTNNNLTPLTVMFVDINRAESSIPTATGLLTNNGTGGVGWSTSLSLDELDVNNGYITNFFTGKTNYNLLGTDGNGMLTLGSGAVTNITITNAFIQFLTNQILYSTNIYVSNLYSDTNFTTNLYFNQGKGNTMIVTNVAIYGVQTNFNIAASSAVITKADQVLTNAVNAVGAFTNSASGPPSFGLIQSNVIAAGISPILNLVASTNFYATNDIHTPTLWGGPSNSVVINNGYQQYATSTPTSITNQTTTSVWATLVISNSLSTSITQYCTVPNIRYIGANSTNALTVGAGKVGVWSFLTFAGQMTNCVNLGQQ